MFFATALIRERNLQIYFKNRAQRTVIRAAERIRGAGAKLYLGPYYFQATRLKIGTHSVHVGSLYSYTIANLQYLQ